MMTKAALRTGCAILLTLGLAACGGGGGGVGTTPTPTPAPTPTPTPIPTPTPTPGPTPSAFDTAEYRASRGLVLANAIPAYERGATGRGVLAGIIDSGIDIDSPEFTGRISAASTDTAGSRSIQDEAGHGTAVTTILGAAKNDRQVHGVAYDASLLVLRTDTPGSCATTGPMGESGCTHADPAIARALDVATGAGARVVNISLGGAPAGAVLRAAIDRATASGMVIVMSAGNDSAAQIDPLATVANDPAIARGLILVVGSTDGTGTISSFSNRAGASRDVYLTALGERLQANDQNGDSFLWTGTSFSAPHVAGAVALLAQAFPNMTGQQIVQLLLGTARDAGATGVDAVYGHGLLDIGRAFQPQGAMSLAGSRVPVSMGTNATLSSAMGDAAQSGQAIEAVLLDQYQRPFGVTLSGTLRSATPRLPLAAALQSAGQTRLLSSGGTMMALTIADRQGAGGRDGVSIERLLLSRDDLGTARAMAGSIATRLGRSTEARFAIAQGAAGLTAAMVGRDAPSFLIAGRSGEENGFERRSDASFAVRHDLGRFGLTVSGETGDALVYSREGVDAIRNRFRAHRYTAASVGVDRRFGELALSLAATRLIERDTALGARFDPLIGAGGGRSWFVDADMAWQGGNGWSVGMSWRNGWTAVDAGGAVASAATIRSTGFSIDAARRGLFGGGDMIAIRIAQPLRVSRGGFDLSLPVAYDYRQGVTAYALQRIDLAPQGSERDFELRYERPLLWGRIGTNLYLRRQPGNLAWMSDDIGAAVRFRLDW